MLSYRERRRVGGVVLRPKARLYLASSRTNHTSDGYNLAASATLTLAQKDKSGLASRKEEIT